MQPRCCRTEVAACFLHGHPRLHVPGWLGTAACKLSRPFVDFRLSGVLQRCKGPATRSECSVQGQLFCFRDIVRGFSRHFLDPRPQAAIIAEKAEPNTNEHLKPWNALTFCIFLLLSFMMHIETSAARAKAPSCSIWCFLWFFYGCCLYSVFLL